MREKRFNKHYNMYSIFILVSTIFVYIKYWYLIDNDDKEKYKKKYYHLDSFVSLDLRLAKLFKSFPVLEDTISYTSFNLFVTDFFIVAYLYFYLLSFAFRSSSCRFRTFSMSTFIILSKSLLEIQFLNY
jgi:hypothetical protein